MSRTTEFNAGQGSVHHPNVDHYRDGGMGGIGPERSVVGMVPTHVLIGLRHHDGQWDGDGMASDLRVIEGLRKDLREGRGFHTPVHIEYDHVNQWSYLGEGNHRLAAAIAEGIPELPARVVRSPNAGWLKGDGVGMQTTHHPIPGASPGYIPSDIHPSYLKFGHTEDPQAPVHRREERGAADSTLDEIGRLLEPVRRQT